MITDEKIRVALFAKFRNRPDWHAFIDSPQSIACDHPLDAAIKLARLIPAGNVTAIACEIVGLMLESFSTGMEIERMAVEDAL